MVSVSVAYLSYFVCTVPIIFLFYVHSVLFLIVKCNMAWDNYIYFCFV